MNVGSYAKKVFSAALAVVIAVVVAPAPVLADGCSDVFPGALQTHVENGSVAFSFNSQLLNTGYQIATKSIQPLWGG
ncbi:hypothetical protein [Pelagibaculum spongiae]|uniref:Uncharacterized protein n=1 Tax=Pelagibaculum spongiae TaxID=2080658 RepID=A0A2V1GR90_9GAMM|nr:hypothetical protein [Pelagibaculum spongiae]PVZ63530.1 hypothetical protein DC094_20825 [Pelagibaculum spongiae]